MTTPRRLLVVSPHCDDAVLSCGDLLREHAGAAVVTVFAASPSRCDTLTDWDRRGGFVAGEDVMAARRLEDAQALASLSAEPHWLPFLDEQYGPRPSVEEVADALDAAVDRLQSSRFVLPMGLFHTDHLLAHDAAVALLARRRVAEWLVYEDAPYRRLPALVTERLAALRTSGLTVTRCIGNDEPASGAKRRALDCYASQVRALSSLGRAAIADVHRPERYWRVEAGRRPTHA